VHAADTETELRTDNSARPPIRSFRGHFGVIRNAGRQTRRRRFVPRRQPRLARQLTDFVLRQIRFVQRTADAEFARGLTAGPVVATIVGVIAVKDDRLMRRGDANQMRIQFVLAEVTAIGGV
jgi:hypothetical protein